LTPALIAALRAAHVVAGAFWLGALLLNAGFLLPAVSASGPAGGQVMREIVHVRRLPAWLNAAVATVLATGAILYWVVSGGLSASWMASRTGIAWSAGAALAVAAALLGVLVSAPTARRFGQLAGAAQAAGGPPSAETAAEMRRLQGRLLGATRLAALLVAAAAVAMASARYVG